MIADLWVVENIKCIKSDEINFYFAYGSNMDEGQMAERCPNATLVGKALLNGYQFIINSLGVATVVPEEAKRVYGLVWRITEICEASLDESEGVKYGTYRKEMVNVIGPNRENLIALIYIARDSRAGVPRAGYLEKIITAAKKNSFSEDYLHELKDWEHRG